MLDMQLLELLVGDADVHNRLVLTVPQIDRLKLPEAAPPNLVQFTTASVKGSGAH